MKRATALAMLAVLSLVAAGCGGGGEDNGNQVQVVLDQEFDPTGVVNLLVFAVPVDDTDYAQTFTASVDGILDAIALYLGEFQAPDQPDFVVGIWPTDANGVPEENVAQPMGMATVLGADAASNPSAFHRIDFRSQDIPIEAGETYAIVVQRDPDRTATFWTAGEETDGEMWNRIDVVNGGLWSAISTVTLGFRTFVELSAP